MMRPPWWQRRGLRAILLLPFGLLYAVLDVVVRLVQRPALPPAPVIAIGNLTAGGAGKTPIAQAIAHLCLAKGRRPAILSRGYGRQAKAPLRVDVSRHSAQDVGDEPLLHGRICPTYVGRDRLEIAHLAVEDGADALLLDDGLHHHRLAKSLTIEVRNQADGLGNGWPLPAGPLRQWFGLGAGSVDLLLIVGQDALIEAQVPEGLAAGQPLAAFCGIADPEKFWATLADLGLQPATRQAFPDHHAFSEAELAALRLLVQDHGVVTTQKDWVRLPPDLQHQIKAVPYSLRLKDPEALWQALLRAFGQGQQGDV